MSPIISVGVFNDYDKICNELESLHSLISSSSIYLGEKGSVIYMVKKDNDSSNKDEVLSIFKIHTLEYLLLKTMRQKLLQNINGKF